MSLRVETAGCDELLARDLAMHIAAMAPAYANREAVPAKTMADEREIARAKAAGLTQIDHLLTTHWHGDHFGGMTELVKLIPVKDFMDHGPNAKWPGVGADLIDVPGRLVAADKWQLTGKLALDVMNIAVADGGGGDADLDLAFAGRGQVYVFDNERLVEFVTDGSFHGHLLDTGLANRT